MESLQPRSMDFDVTARERQVVGAVPRIAPVAADEIDEASWTLAGQVRASAGGAPLEALSPHMRTMLKHPEIFRCQMDMSAVIFRGSVPKRERELAVLRIAWLARAPYEWGEHVDIGKRYGLTVEEIERVTYGSAAPGWSQHDFAVLRAVEELMTHHALSDETWKILSSRWDESQLIEFVVLVGHYLGLALIQNSLRIQLRPNNPGLMHR